MGNIVEAKGLTRSFGDVKAVDNMDFTVGAGSVLGLIGPNGAGKTTMLKALLGLAEFSGDVQVLGINPRSDRASLMEQVCFIADTAVLPRWMRVDQLLDYVTGVHPRFNREQAEKFLADTDVQMSRKIRHLSKGMMVQLHLALVMAIDARLLILDEPTLGLDILYRKRFFEQLISDYFNEERTIIISTHQVEEVQHILTDVMFMNRGKLVLSKSMESIEEEFVQLNVVGDAVAEAQGIPHLGSQNILGGKSIIYEGIGRTSLEALGDVRTPSVSDLFVAMMGGDR